MWGRKGEVESTTNREVVLLLFCDFLMKWRLSRFRTPGGFFVISPPKIEGSSRTGGDSE